MMIWGLPCACVHDRANVRACAHFHPCACACDHASDRAYGRSYACDDDDDDDRDDDDAISVEPSSYL